MKFIFLVALLFSAACSVAPMMTTRNARPLGEGQNKIQISPGIPVLGISYERGLSDKWDMGLAAESQLTPVFSGFTKYSFVNKEEGTSVAASGGVFYGTGFIDSYGGYVGPILSWRKNWFEFFVFPRYNYVHWNGLNLDSNNDTDALFFDFVSDNTSVDLHYVQIDTGINFYTKSRFSFGVGVSYFYFLDPKYIDGTSVGWLPEFLVSWTF